MNGTPDHVPEFNDERKEIAFTVDWPADAAYCMSLWLLKDYLGGTYGQKSMKMQMNDIALGWAKSARDRARGRYAESGDETEYQKSMKMISDIRDSIIEYSKIRH